MPRKFIFRRCRANEDIDAAIAFYLDEAGADVAMGFIDDLEATQEKISNRTSAGSPHYGHELRISGLRSWPMKRFPYPIFYLEKEGRIEVARVLHERTDILAWLDDD